MTETYKYKSKIATAIAFIATFIVYIGKDEIAKLLPTEYAFLASFIVILAGYILAQSTENKRVEVAEQMVHEQYDQDDAPGITSTEDITPITDGDEDDTC